MLAVVLWLQVSHVGPTAPVERIIRSVPVSWHDLPQGLAVASVSPRTVDVTVSGGGPAINSLNSGSLAATLNLGGANAGRLVFYPEIAVPRGVTMVQVAPQNVTVVLEAVIDRQRQVTARPSGSVAEGYRTGTPVITPAQVIVHGPQTAVDSVASVVATVAIGGATSDVTSTVQLSAVDAKGQPVSGVITIPAKVQVTVPVRPAVSAKAFPVTIDVQGKPAAGFLIGGSTAKPAQVVLSGPDSVLAGLKTVSTAPVDVSGAKAVVHTTVSVILPQGVTAAQPDSVNVTVKIKAAPKATGTATSTSGSGKSKPTGGGASGSSGGG